MLHANSSSIDTHLGGGSFGHLGVIISDAAYEMIYPLTTWENPEFHGQAVKLLPLPHLPVRARTDARTNPSAQRAT
jgi:hypothetical protein